MNKLFLLSQLLPSFLLRTSAPLDKIHPTSYLDGLRGIAALCVFMYHHVNRVFRHFLPGYGYPLGVDGSPAVSNLLQLPFWRLIYTGRPMVHLFFVISGYCLSLKPLKQIRRREHAAFLRTISSSVLRRGMRLYLPLYIALSIAILLGCMHLKPITGTDFSSRVKHGLYSLYVYANFIDLTKMWRSGLIEQHLWTIPIEMGFSMILFIILIGLSRVTSAARIVAVMFMIVYLSSMVSWAGVEFLFGMLLAEIGLIQDSWADAPQSTCNDTEAASGLLSSTPTESYADEKLLGLRTVSRPNSLQRYVSKLRRNPLAMQCWRTACWMNLICGLFIFSWPDENSLDAATWNFFVSHLTPGIYIDGGILVTQAFWFGIAATQVVFSCQQLPILQQLLTTRAPQYLGKISYAVYLMHMSVLDVFDRFIVPPIVYLTTGKWRTWTPYRQTGGKGGILTFVLTTGLLIVPLIWIADLFWRYVDAKCVKLAARVEQMVLEDVNDDNGRPA